MAEYPHRYPRVHIEGNPARPSTRSPPESSRPLPKAAGHRPDRVFEPHTIDGEQKKLSDRLLTGHYHYPPAGDEDTDEYVVPVEWITTRPRELAVHKKGLFANQNSACKLRNRFTLDTLYTEFGLDDADSDVQRQYSHRSAGDQIAQPNTPTEGLTR